MQEMNNNSSQNQELTGLFNALISSNTSDLFCLHRAEDKRIVFTTQSSQNLLGVNSQEMIGKLLTDFIAPEFKESLDAELLNKMLYKPRTPVKLMLFRQDGSRIWTRTKWTIAQISGSSSSDWLLSVTTDITESVGLMEDLTRAWSKEKEIHELRSSLFAIASHAFKTPLAVLQMQADMLNSWIEKDKLDSRYNRVCYNIEKQINRLNGIVSDIVQYRKTILGEEQMEPISLDIEMLGREIIQEALEAYPNNSIDLELIGINKEIRGDKRMLRYILSNLLENACKFSPNYERVKIVFDFKAKENLVIYIQDKGIGIPKEDITKLFKPFYRASNAVNIEGTGVALAIVKEFVILHYGHIKVESNLGKGTIFTLELPFALFLP